MSSARLSRVRSISAFTLGSSSYGGEKYLTDNITNHPTVILCFIVVFLPSLPCWTFMSFGSGMVTSTTSQLLPI